MGEMKKGDKFSHKPTRKSTCPFCQSVELELLNEADINKAGVLVEEWACCRCKAEWENHFTYSFSTVSKPHRIPKCPHCRKELKPDTIVQLAEELNE